MPHERDESAGSQDSSSAANSDVGRQAHADVTSGKVDTDRGPVVDAMNRGDQESRDRAEGTPRESGRSRSPSR